MQEGLRELEILLDPYEWFYEVVAEARRYVVYVTYMEGSQDAIIPDFVQGKQVVVHFASTAPGYKTDYVSKPTSLSFDRSSFQVAAPKRAEPLYVSETPSIQVLTDELDRLERQCGSNILQDIFYEIHDGKNAVTNLRAKFPDVHNAMIRLYNDYGFDTIYDELDG